MRLELEGAARAARAVALSPLPGKTHYFLGNDPRRWRSDVPTFARVRYAAVYPGVDVVYYGNQRQLEYDFIVAPGADPRRIAQAIAQFRSQARLAPNATENQLIDALEQAARRRAQQVGLSL